LMEPLCEIEEIPPALKKRDALYQQAWSLIQAHQYSDALKILKHLHQKFPEDGLYEVMVARVEAYLVQPPSATWDGVFVLDSK